MATANALTAELLLLYRIRILLSLVYVNLHKTLQETFRPLVLKIGIPTFGPLVTSLYIQFADPSSNFLPIKMSPSINQYMYACMQLGGGLPPTVIGGGSKDLLGD